jgi:dolichol kinase
MFSEKKRQVVHILLFLLAFLFKYLNKGQAFLLLFLFLFIILFIVPKLRVKSYFYRRGENQYSQGAVWYFLVLLVLVLIFPLPVVAATWAILALGDGTATLIGKNFKTKELPWNRQKSYAGILSFVIFGGFGAFILLKWMLPDLTGVLMISFKTALIAGIAESLPLKINDNVTVAVTSALILNWFI